MHIIANLVTFTMSVDCTCLLVVHKNRWFMHSDLPSIYLLKYIYLYLLYKLICTGLFEIILA